MKISRLPFLHVATLLVLCVCSSGCGQPQERLESLFLSIETEALQGNQPWSTPAADLPVADLPALTKLWRTWKANPCYFSVDSTGGLDSEPHFHYRLRAVVESYDHYVIWHRPFEDDTTEHAAGEEYQNGEEFWGVSRSGGVEGASAWTVAAGDMKQIFPRDLPFGPGVGLAPIQQMLGFVGDDQTRSRITENVILLSLDSQEEGISKTTTLSVDRMTGLPIEIDVSRGNHSVRKIRFMDFRVLHHLREDMTRFDESRMDFFLISDDRKQK